MSNPSSRSSSIQPPSRSFSASGSSTPIPRHASVSSLPQREHTTTLSHKLRHMFDTQRYAIFTTTVLVEELSNVPQLQGEFAARWKFRGRRPRNKEVEPAKISNKPSLPNLKFSTLHPSSSSLSIRTTSTGASMPISSNTPIPNRQGSMPPPLATSRGKANTLPLSPLQPQGQFSANTLIPPKKASDPTPLRQSVVTSSSVSLTPVSSPEVMEEPIEDPALAGPGGRNSLESGYSRDEPLIAPSIASKPQDGKEHYHNLLHLLPGRHPHGQPYLHPGGGARSASQSSSMMTIDSVTGKGDDTLLKSQQGVPSRRASIMTASTSTSSSDASSSYSSIPQPQQRPGGPVRQRSTSAASTSTIPQPRAGLYSSNRKGITPPARLKAHTCTWNYELNHMMKIPLTKPIPVAPTSGTASPRTSRPPLPVLGAGPLSESGIRIIIEQLPTPAATRGASPGGANKDSTSSAMTAVHNVEKSLNPSEGRKASGSVGEKTIFGIVDIDLAAFAGKGKTTRRFLLRGSRTNATVKLTVDMRWAGGEEAWVAPPMQEGHHVTGITDIAGSEAVENIKNDLNLVKTPSNSSSGSSGFSLSNPSMASSLNLSRTVSSVSHTGALGPQLTYKSYDHHLRPPEPSTQLSPRRFGSRSPAPPTPGHESSTSESVADLSHLSPTMSPSATSHHTHHKMNLHRVHTHTHTHTHAHHHTHTHHMVDSRGIPRTSGMHELPPNVVIEHIFNPHPATEEGPFTYIPETREDTAALGGEQAVLDRVIESVLGRQVMQDGEEGGSSPVLGDDGVPESTGDGGQGQGHGRDHSRWARMRARVGNGRSNRGERGAKMASVGA